MEKNQQPDDFLSFVAICSPFWSLTSQQKETTVKMFQWFRNNNVNLKTFLFPCPENIKIPLEVINQLNKSFGYKKFDTENEYYLSIEHDSNAKLNAFESCFDVFVQADIVALFLPYSLKNNFNPNSKIFWENLCSELTITKLTKIILVYSDGFMETK